MPFDPIEYQTRDFADGEPLAMAISYIAYPFVKRQKERLAFQRALYRYALLDRATKDKAWAENVQLVRVSDIVERHPLTSTEFKRAMKKFEAAMLMSTHFLEPNLSNNQSKNRPARLPNGDLATVENAADFVRRRLGWKGNTVATFKHDVWAPTKRICHLALALSEVLTSFKHSFPTFQLFYDAFFEPNFDDSVFRRSEDFRLKIAKRPSLRMPEGSTYQFFKVRPVPKPLRFSQLP